MFARSSYILGSLLLCCSANAQFVPVTAKVRSVNETIVSGKTTKSVTKEGFYYRTSDGSTLTQWTTVNGDAAASQVAWGGLWDNKTGTSYNLDFKNRRAYVQGEGETRISADTKWDEPKNPTYDSVSGLRCTISPALIQLPDGTQTPAGHTCMSTEYHLMLKQDITQKGANGITMHTLYELYDLRLGVEPEAKLFDVSKQFTVYRPDAKND